MRGMRKATLRKIRCYSYTASRQQQRAIGSCAAANKPPFIFSGLTGKMSFLMYTDVQNRRVAQLKIVVQMS